MNLSGPAMLVVGVIGLIWVGLYLVGLGRRWGILVPFGLMLLASSIAVALDYYGNTVQTVWLPVQSRRAIIFVAGGLAAGAVLLVQFRNNSKIVPISSLLLVVMGVYAALLRFHHIGPGDGAQSLLFAIATLIPLVFVAPLLGSTANDFRAGLRCIAVVNVAWIVMCALQFLVDYQALTMGNEFRFVGLTGNPQHAGAFIAFWGVVSLWLLLNDRGRFLRLLYMGLVGCNMVMLVWTGSRTGLGMAVIGVASIMYSRLGRAILLMPLVVILSYIGFKAVLAVTGLEVGVDRITGGGDTRSAAWATLYRVGSENPILGAGTDDAERSENSWLYAFASYGIGMLALAFLFTAVAAWEFLRAVRLRSSLMIDDRRMLDLSLGIMVMYFAGAVLEGYMIARVSAATCFFMIFAGVAAGLTQRAAWARTADFDEYPGELIESDEDTAEREDISGPAY